MNPYPTVSLIRTPDEYKAVIEAARADSDNINWPSHVVKDTKGTVIGAASVASVPLLLVWNNSQTVKVRDSLHLQRIYRSIMETKGHTGYFVACNKNSPYNKHMQDFGYNKVWETEIFYEQL
tara:strand:+ start:56 stop:421 length:366 start_codon:yes stop_codon:yes gene_type:complete